MAEKIVNATGLEEFSKEIKKSVPLIGSSSSGSSFSFDSMGSYSSKEIETPFKWIDGKTIYKKTIETHPTSSGNTVIIAYSNQFIIKVEGFVKSEKNGKMVPTLYNDNSPSVNSFYRWNDTNLSWISSHNFSNYTLYTTIWYTKN